jgi:DhnA family fructose-bisphosphate aldolase class Ia
MEYLARLVGEAAPWNLPVLAEALPGGFAAGPEQRTAEAVAFATRTAGELGVDFVKTAYTGSAESFASVVESSYLPVVILGGAADTPPAFLQMVSDAMSAGASGVAVGRNIWQHPHPARMTRAIVAIVHEGMRVDHALELLEAKVPPVRQ